MQSVEPFEFGGNEKFAFVGDLIPGVCGGVIMLELSFEEVTVCPDPEALFIELLREGGSEEDIDLLDAFSAPLYSDDDVSECFDIGEVGID